MSTDHSKRAGGLVQALMASTGIALCLAASPARAATFNVTNESELRTAIFTANTNGDPSDTITLTGDITLTQSLPMITESVTINGGGNTLDADNAGRAIFVQAGTVAVNDLTIDNALAQGGNGGGGISSGGGGGLGAGAAIFVNSGADVTVSNVTIGDAAAIGGAGGNGGGIGGGGGGGGGGLGGDGGASSISGGGGGGGYEGAGGSSSDKGGGGGGGEFGNGGSTSSNGGGGGGGATANGSDAAGATGGTGGGAEGGDGGNDGGSGGAGADHGGGGGSGYSADDAGDGGIGGGGGGSGFFSDAGGDGGDFGGGGGGRNDPGGDGGFGGGGGGARANADDGGAGGFGAGGGGGKAGGASGGFGGAGGSSTGTGTSADGGGGAALGGAVFVREGGSLTIIDGSLSGTYGVTGGSTGGTGGATAGQAQGDIFFLHNTAVTELQVTSGTQTISGTDAFAGDGTLVKSGAGTLAVTGTNANFLGTVTVNGGLLTVDGSLGTILLGNGGTIGGTGTIGTVTAVAGSTVAPGNSIGTLNVAGNVTFAPGSTYEVEIDSGGNSDLVAATGTATINGGTVHVIPFPDYAVGTSYTILTAANVTGTFDAVTATGISFLYAPTLAYTATEVTLIIGTADYETANQNTLATVVAGLGAGNPLFDPVSAAASPAAALDALSGDLHASANGMFLDDSRFVRDAATERLREAFDDGTAGWSTGFWGTAYGALGRRDGDAVASDFDRHTGGILAGMDGAFGNGWRGGFVTGFGATSFDTATSSGSANSYHIGAYAGGMAGGYGLTGGAAFALHQLDTTRAVSIGALDETLSAGYNASTAQVFGEVSRTMTLGDTSFEPFAAAALVHQHNDGFTETGGDAALTAASASHVLGVTTLGMRAETDTREIGGPAMKFHGGIAWRHAFGDVTPETSMRFSGGGSAFGIASAPADRDSMIVEAGVEIAVSDSADLSFEFRGEIGGAVRDASVKADFSMQF